MTIRPFERTVTTILGIIASVAAISITACSQSNKFNTFKRYSEIAGDAYSGKNDIDPDDHGIFMKTAAGFLTFLNDRDAGGIEGLFCANLLSMKGSHEKTEALVEQFKGEIVDTSPLGTDLSTRRFAQWSKKEPVAFYDDEFIVYTTEDAYWVSLSLYSVCSNRPDGGDLVGINSLRILTLDRKFEMKRESEKTDDEETVIDRYLFADGTAEEMEVWGSCGMLVSLGDGSEYQAINTAKGSSFSVFKLTGTKDEISEEEIRSIDFMNKREAYASITSHEPYAVGERSSVTKIISQTCFYNIKGNDHKLYVHFSGDQDGEPYISYVMIMDINRLLTEQNAEIVFRSH